MGSASSSEPAPPAREQSYCGPGRSRGRRSQFHPAQEPGLPYLPTNAGGARPWRATAREILLGSPDRLPHRESRTRRHNSQVILLQFLRPPLAFGALRCGLVPPPPFGGSFRGETGCCVWHVGGGEASAVMPRQALEPVCPRVSLGPSRRSFIGEARASVRRALPQVRVHVTAPSRAEAVASKEVST